MEEQKNPTIEEEFKTTRTNLMIRILVFVFAIVFALVEIENNLDLL